MPAEFRIFSFLCIWFPVIVLPKIIYNTYTVEQYRTTEFVPQVIEKTCLLKPDPGPCRANISMYYFAPTLKTCTKFRWGGCQGNGNRFDNLTECLNRCWSKVDQPKRRPNFCKLTFDYGYCFGDEERWYFDRLWKVCKQTIYSGCGGNKNNFRTEEKCDSVCRFGIGRVTKVPKSGQNIKKVLIVNPPSATSKRGLNQTTTKLPINATRTANLTRSTKIPFYNVNRYVKPFLSFINPLNAMRVTNWPTNI